MNSSYDLNIDRYHFSACDKIITIITLFILFIYFILEFKDVKTDIIYNTFFKLWLTLLFVSGEFTFYLIILLEKTENCMKNLSKYNFFKMESLIYLSIIVSLYFLFNITFYDFFILLHFNSLFVF